MTHHLYLSPHLDDAIYSCGGLIAQQTAQGEHVTVLTICAGDPLEGGLSAFASELEERWGESTSPVAARRDEDAKACASLGASYVHLDIPDAIYRRGPGDAPIYTTEQAIFGDVHESEAVTSRQIAQDLDKASLGIDHIYCPLGIGGHVDHRLVRQAAETLERDLWYYTDFPYAARDRSMPDDLGWPAGRQITVSLSEAAIEAWVEGILHYRSQISTFWDDATQIARELHEYLEKAGGVRVFAPR
jgi:LmbE family N-acetylglucosaminyl deacetylase